MLTKRKLNIALKLFKALSEEFRIKILYELLINEALCVADLTKKLKKNQSAVSMQLSKLKHMGFVDFKRKGKLRIYYIKNKKLKQTLKSLFNIIDAL